MAVYIVERRDLPNALQRRGRILRLPIGRKRNYQRPWVLVRDGLPIGFYETEGEARVAIP